MRIRYEGLRELSVNETVVMYTSCIFRVFRSLIDWAFSSHLLRTYFYCIYDLMEMVSYTQEQIGYVSRMYDMCCIRFCSAQPKRHTGRKT